MYLGGKLRWVPLLFAFYSYSLPLVLVIPIRAKLQGPGVRRAIRAELGLNFNPGFFLFKSIFQDNFLNSF